MEVWICQLVVYVMGHFQVVPNENLCKVLTIVRQRVELDVCLEITKT